MTEPLMVGLLSKSMPEELLSRLNLLSSDFEFPGLLEFQQDPARPPTLLCLVPHSQHSLFYTGSCFLPSFPFSFFFFVTFVKCVP